MKKISWNDGWKYGKQDSAERQNVIIPHDAMLHETRSKEAPGGSAVGYFPGGKYVYEKDFDADEQMMSGEVILEFEGVYKNAKVYLNDEYLGGADYGYRSFFIYLSSKIKEGSNKLSVTCDNSDQPDSRWYSGAGIFRPVWMWLGAKGSIHPETVRISTKSLSPAVIHISSMCEIGAEIDGNCGSGTEFDIEIPNARLWSENDPFLYTARISNELDELEIRFGIRVVTWDGRGLYLNGKRVLLKGGCLHHDNGILGAATWDQAEYRRVKMLKDAGFNAIRSAHNPASRAMLEACDELGMYVMDETWDMWFKHKSKADYADLWEKNYKDDINAIVSRDFNHPSVIMYSIGNEVSEPAKDKGLQKEKEMVEMIHGLDPTRPVTGGFNLLIISNSAKGKDLYKEDGGRDESGDKKMQGMNSTMFNLITSMVGTGMNKAANSDKADKATSPALDLLDIAGYNYASGRYQMDGKKHPGRLIVGSETFPQDIWKNWDMVKNNPWLIGDFMWTAWDYLGEAGIGAWAYTDDGKGFNKPYPWLLADCGAFDILGNPNGELYLAQAAWNTLKAPAIAVQPVNHQNKRPAKAVWRGTNAFSSWSFRGCDGNKAIVEVYTDKAYVELIINGKTIGKKKAKDGKAIFRVRYAGGEIVAKAYDLNGNPSGEAHLKSAKEKLFSMPLPERRKAKTGDIIYVPICVQDDQGIVESNSDRLIKVSVEGGVLLGAGSANPRTEEKYDEGQFTTYYGRALAVIYADKKGTIKITVNDKDGCNTVEIPVEE